MSHKGAYICTAENEAGKDKRRIYLNVKCKYIRGFSSYQSIKYIILTILIFKGSFCPLY